MTGRSEHMNNTVFRPPLAFCLNQAAFAKTDES